MNQYHDNCHHSALKTTFGKCNATTIPKVLLHFHFVVRQNNNITILLILLHRSMFFRH